MSIEFRVTPRDEDLFTPLVVAAVEQTRARTVYDLGGGANPVLPEDIIAAHGVRYLLVDSSEDELALAPSAYTKVLADPASPGFDPPEPGDLVLTRWVLEHIRDPETFHRNVLNLLKPGGRALHFFPTLYALPFLLNRLLPDPLAARILRLSEPARELDGRKKKFPALYRWCRGPSARQVRRFTELGFEVKTYVGLFGHGYFRRISPLQRAEDRLAAVLARLRATPLTSYALVDLRKPGGRI
jgi:SAM-dependent methyltransferase